MEYKYKVIWTKASSGTGARDDPYTHNWPNSVTLGTKIIPNGPRQGFWFKLSVPDVDIDGEFRKRYPSRTEPQYQNSEPNV